MEEDKNESIGPFFKNIGKKKAEEHRCKFQSYDITRNNLDAKCDCGKTLAKK